MSQPGEFISPIIDLTGVQHHVALTEMVDVLCNKTQNDDRGFFQVEVAYFLGKMAANMRAMIVTKDRGEIPVNIYALALATSGFGKGHSVSIIEEQLMRGFKRRFMEDTMKMEAENNFWAIANDRAAKDGTDQEEEFKKVEKLYNSKGAFPFTFDSGTSPAVKQLREKLLLSKIGSINLQIDEIGSNLVANTEVLTLFLELYDQGVVKQKLVKNTNDNQRAEELDGRTPTNMLLFGTPSKLFDGGLTEEQFYSFLDTGYARRCLFGYGHLQKRASHTTTAAEIYHRLTNPTNQAAVNKWANHFHDLADPQGYGWRMEVEDAVAIKLLEYRLACEKAAELLPEHEEIQKAELNHRYFKALKLAGAYAFVDASAFIELDHLMSAILLVEQSGEAFKTILSREKPYVRLARYVGDVGTEVTHADLIEALPFYPKSRGPRDEMMNLATAWGYRRHTIIKKTFVDGIEFFKGEKLTETNLEEMVISYSDHWAYRFNSEKVPFNQLHLLTQAVQDNGQPMHWANHGFKNEHRKEENVLAGFNMVVLDVDESISVLQAHELLKDYRHLIYTTKRHQVDTDGTVSDRFRVLMPINYQLELDRDEYKEFMDSILEWLPFKVDESVNQRSKKWETFSGGEYHYNDGDLLDALPFIPKTDRNRQFRDQNRELQSLDNLERWFAQRIASGNRNNQMIKYALALMNGGMDLPSVSRQVHSFNKRLSNPLAEDEIESTILVTVAKRLQRAGE